MTFHKVVVLGDDDIVLDKTKPYQFTIFRPICIWKSEGVQRLKIEFQKETDELPRELGIDQKLRH